MNTDPIDEAADLIAAAVEAHHAGGTTRTGLAVVVLGGLLDAGWVLPARPEACRDIATVARCLYVLGRTARQVATETIALHVEVWATVRAARADDPGAFPGWHRDLSTQALGRRVVGELLDVGMLPPARVRGAS